MRSTKKHHTLRRRIFKDAEIKSLTGHMREFMGPVIAAFSDAYGLSIEDMLRFQSLAFRLAEGRAAKGLALKEAAASLRVPKYKLDYIEKASIRNVDPDIALRYVEFLGLKNWLGRWKKATAELSARMGFASIRTRKSMTEKSRRTSGKRSGVGIPGKTGVRLHNAC